MTHRTTLAAIALAALACSPAFAADVAKKDTRSAYEQQRAKCVSGQSNQAQADCLKEAGAALDEEKRGRLTEANPNYQQNQQNRCSVLSGDEQSACLARMQGQGTVSGDAPSGGIFRELRTTEPASTSPAATTPPPAMTQQK